MTQAQPLTVSSGAPYGFQGTLNIQITDNQANPNAQKEYSVSVGGVDSLDTLVNDTLQSQDSFGRWVNRMISVDEPALVSPVIPIQEPYSSLEGDLQQSSLPEQIFNITDVSPSWASSTEKTKVFPSLPIFIYILPSNTIILCIIWFHDDSQPLPIKFVCKRKHSEHGKLNGWLLSYIFHINAFSVGIKINELLLLCFEQFLLRFKKH